MQSSDFAAMRAGCLELHDAVAKLAAELPSPDEALTSTVQSAVDNYGDAFDICQRFSPGTTKEVLDEFKSYFDKGAAQMNAAMKIMNDSTS